MVKPLVGIFFDDVEYFVREVLRRSLVEALPWLMAVAASAPVEVVTGREEVDKILVTDLPVFTECPFVLVAEVCGHEQDAVLKRLSCLQLLRFHCRASIQVFKCMGPTPKAEWPFVFAHIIPQFVQQLHEKELKESVGEPHWFLPPDETDSEVRNTREAVFPVDSVRVVPVLRSDSGFFVFLVRPPDALGGAWTTVGGTPKRGPDGDQSVAHTCHREWDEEILAYSHSFAFADPGARVQHVAWKANSRDWKNWTNRLRAGAGIKDEGVSSAAWLFVEASKDFFVETCDRVVELVPSDAKNVVRKNDPSDHNQRLHSEGFHFVEQEFGAWFRLDLDTGELQSQIEGAVARADLAFNVLRSQSLRKRLGEEFNNITRVQHNASFVHMVSISPEGVRNKSEVLAFSLGRLTTAQSSQKLTACILKGLEGDEYHQFCAEEVEYYLKYDANALEVVRPTGVDLSLLKAVLSNRHLRESVALRSSEFLCRAFRKRERVLDKEESDLLRARASSSSSENLRRRWVALLRHGS